MKLHHTACPECRRNGQDRSGDNLAVYPDGGKFCFSCGYFEASGGKYIPKQESVLPQYEVGHMPSLMRNYLRQFLSDREIDDNFIYDTLRQRAVLKDLLPQFYWGRDPGIDFKKVHSQGEVPFHVFGHGKTLVVVEDPISALAVSRVTASVALFGSYLKPAWYKNLTLVNPDRLVFWLDNDKKQESFRLANCFKHIFNTKYIISTLDPKYYRKEEIKLMLED